MTKTDFVENVNEWWELIEFCDNEGCSVCSDIFTCDELGDKIMSDLIRVCREGTLTWEEIRDRLYDISDSYEYYSESDAYLDYQAMDTEEFQYRKDEVIEWMDDYGEWDEEPEDEDIEEDEPFQEPMVYDEDDEPVPEEAFSVSELISMCIMDVRTLQEADRKRQEEESKRIAWEVEELFLPF